MSRQRKIHPEVVKYEKFNKKFQIAVDKAILGFCIRGIRDIRDTRPRKIIKLMGLPGESVALWNLKQQVRGHNDFITIEEDEF